MPFLNHWIDLIWHPGPIIHLLKITASQASSGRVFRHWRPRTCRRSGGWRNLRYFCSSSIEIWLMLTWGGFGWFFPQKIRAPEKHIRLLKPLSFWAGRNIDPTTVPSTPLTGPSLPPPAARGVTRVSGAQAEESDSKSCNERFLPNFGLFFCVFHHLQNPWLPWFLGAESKMHPSTISWNIISGSWFVGKSMEKTILVFDLQFKCNSSWGRLIKLRAVCGTKFDFV